MPFCPKCGTKLKDKDKYCPECGTSVSKVKKIEKKPEPVKEVQSKAPAAASPTPPTPSKRKIWPIVVGAVIIIGCLLLALGGALAYIMSTGGFSPSKEADESIEVALASDEEISGALKELDSLEEGLDISKGAESITNSAETMKKTVQGALSQVKIADAELKKATTYRIPNWRRDYINLLRKALAERVKALQQWNNLIARLKKMAKVIGLFNEGAAAYKQAMSQLTQAVNKHDSNDYHGAKAMVPQIESLLAEAESKLTQANSLDKSTAIAALLSKVKSVRSWVSDFRRVCDLGISGYTSAHDQLVDKLRPQWKGFSKTLALDQDSWFDKVLSTYLKKISTHLRKADEYRHKAKHLKEKYQ